MTEERQNRDTGVTLQGQKPGRTDERTSLEEECTNQLTPEREILPFPELASFVNSSRRSGSVRKFVPLSPVERATATETVRKWVDNTRATESECTIVSKVMAACCLTG